MGRACKHALITLHYFFPLTSKHCHLFLTCTYFHIEISNMLWHMNSYQQQAERLKKSEKAEGYSKALPSFTKQMYNKLICIVPVA